MRLHRIEKLMVTFLIAQGFEYNNVSMCYFETLLRPTVAAAIIILLRKLYLLQYYFLAWLYIEIQNRSIGIWYKLYNKGIRPVLSIKA